MGFIESYKHLEKLCGEILGDDKPVSAYIDEMINTPRGSLYVRTWEDDLKNLKHYRWVRNQISHEPGCSESNMCEPEDEIWLNHFYSRIMNQTLFLCTTKLVLRLQTATAIAPELKRKVLPRTTRRYTAALIIHREKDEVIHGF